MHYFESDDTFRFEAGSNGRFLYHDTNGAVISSAVADSDLRSRWQAIPASQTLGLSEEILQSKFIKIYTNPAQEKFTIYSENRSNLKEVKIYNILGKIIYQNQPKSNILEVKNKEFKSGMYLVKTVLQDNLVFFSKLIVK